MKGVLIMTILETTQKIDANKIFTCTRRTFTPTFKYKVVKEYEETKRYKAQVIEEHQKEIDKKVEEQNIQQELQALRAENKALKTLLKVYMK